MVIKNLKLWAILEDLTRYCKCSFPGFSVSTCPQKFMCLLSSYTRKMNRTRPLLRKRLFSKSEESKKVQQKLRRKTSSKSTPNRPRHRRLEMFVKLSTLRRPIMGSSYQGRRSPSQQAKPNYNILNNPRITCLLALRATSMSRTDEIIRPRAARFKWDLLYNHLEHHWFRYCARVHGCSWSDFWFPAMWPKKRSQNKNLNTL